MHALFKKLFSREVILYVFFGGVAMAISIGSYYLFGTVFSLHYQIANIISWVLAVATAYFTNKVFVFEAGGVRGKAMFKELFLFLTARLFSLAAEAGGLAILVDWLFMDENISKVIMQVVVVLLNYILSKCIIFKENKKKRGQEHAN